MTKQISRRAHMNEHEQAVRAVWEWCRQCFSEPYEGYAQGVYVVEIPGCKFSHKDEAETWAAAHEYTIGRLEQIKQKREEISFVSSPSMVLRPSGYERGVNETRKRIFAVLESQLAELTKSIKLEALREAQA